MNARLGFAAYEIEDPQGGWYLPLRVSRRLLPGALNGVDAFAALLHYGAGEWESGVGLLPGELFGHAPGDQGFLLRATVAVADPELERFAGRLADAAAVFSRPDGRQAVAVALGRARAVADTDAILAACRY